MRDFKMKIVLLLVVLSICDLFEVQGDAGQFLRMIRKITGKRLFYPYGFTKCQCKDQDKRTTDRCCSAHDCCYLKLKKKGCKPKRLKYHYVIQAQSVLCGNGNKCQKKVCACDKAAAYCMKKNVKNYQAI
ncbi:phospholipase A2, membrane associated-like isoform 1-T1 [Sarcophilus harrisii]